MNYFENALDNNSAGLHVVFQPQFRVKLKRRNVDYSICALCNNFENLVPLRKSSSKKLIYRNFWVEFRKGKTCRLPQSVVKIATSLLVYILCAHCGKMKKKTPTKEIFRESNSLSSKFSSKYVIFTKFTVRVNFRDFHTSLIKFREINSHFWDKISWNQHFSRHSKQPFWYTKY